jgi:hypothetical protein
MTAEFPISKFRLPIGFIASRQSKIGNHKTHPLPRGGTDLMVMVEPR